MREIKFRAQREDNKEFIFGEFIRTTSGWMITNYDSIDLNASNGESMLGDIMAVKIIKETLGQFTGLKDRNGVEIYEGDVVKHFDHSGIIREVIFMKGSFGYWTGDEFISYASNYHFEWKDLNKSENIEVIGSIHSIPELIK